MILADTSAWIEAFRKADSQAKREIDLLLARQEIAITGIVLAEVLQGARDEAETDRLGSALGSLPFLEVDQNTWAQAGRLAFQLRRQGRAVPITDALVAAVAIEHGCALYTLDQHFQRVPGLKLHGH